MLLTQSTSVDFEQLCGLDVLGLSDSSANDQDVVCAKFKEQLMRDPEGYYETGLLYKQVRKPQKTAAANKEA